MSDMTMPAIKYKQGKRDMFLVVDDARALTQTFIEPRKKDLDPRNPDEWGNRRLDIAHKKGIIEYLETEDEYVIGAAVLYVKPATVHFEPVNERWADKNVQLGQLHIPIGTKFHVGDGQHRMKAYADVLEGRDDDDEVFKRIVASGQPAIIVEEERGWKIALDFVDLGHNAKPLTTSLGFALDVRQPLNKLAFQLARELEVLRYVPTDGSPEDAGRIEFQGNAVGKGSAKLYTFASWRYAVATYLLGFDTRDKRKIAKETKATLGDESSDTFKKTLGEMKTVFAYAARKLPGWQHLLTLPTTYTAREFREKSVLGTSAGLTALAYALKAAKDGGVPYQEAIDRLATINWSKETVEDKPPFFDHTIIVGGKVLSSRTNYEPAGQDLARVALGEDVAKIMQERHEAFVKQLNEAKKNLEKLAA